MSYDISEYTWQGLLAAAVEKYLIEAGGVDDENILNTPDRVVKAWEFYKQGCHEDPAAYLKKSFTAKRCDEMVHVKDVTFVSVCSHHLATVVGKAHLAYIPDSNVVGFSKIPRFIKMLSRRPTLQEDLTQDMVDVFNDVVKPKGCGVFVKAFHFCMIARGVEEHSAYAMTTAFTGCFKEGSSKQEFLLSVDTKGNVFP